MLKFVKYGVLIVIALILIAVLNPFVVIDSWYAWVKSNLWKIDNNELKPGLHFRIPLIQSVQKLDVKVNTVDYKANDQESKKVSYDGFWSSEEWIDGKPAIVVLDKRWLPLSIELTVLFQLKQDFASETLAEYWINWSEKLVNPTIREIVRDIIWQYEAETIPEKRTEIAEKVKAWLQKKTEKFYFSIADVQLRNIDLPAQVQQKIQEVQIAKQESEKQKYELEKAKIEAETKKTKAEWEAKAQIESAKWQAESIRLTSEAQSEWNKKIIQSLNPDLIRYKSIEKWDWVLPKVSWQSSMLINTNDLLK